MRTKEKCEGLKNPAGRVAPCPTGIRRRGVAWVCWVAALWASAAPAPAAPADVGGKRELRTMQVNLYVGGGIERAVELNPADPGYITNLIATVTGIYYEILASRPPVRLQRVAEEISARMPEVVSVEEASLIRLESPGDLIVGGTNLATHVVFDYLQLLVNALNARGAHYAVAAVTAGFDVEMPMLNLQTGTLDDARLTDREAILVRTDLPPGQFQVGNPQGGNFRNVVQVPGTGLALLYGWCSVDVFARGQSFRYICAHLMTETAPQIQVLQAQELLEGPANTRLPVMLVGDFNADALGRDGSVAYGTITSAGFSDAWAVLHPNDPAGGLTWGHDEFLADPNTRFDRRIDLVFYRGAGFVPSRVEVIDLGLDRQPPPFWASDHAALAAKVQIQRAPFERSTPPHSNRPTDSAGD